MGRYEFEREKMMVLVDVRKENAWLLSTFRLTYKVGWEKICKAVKETYDFYEGTEVVVDGKKVEVTSKDDILLLEEGSRLTIRGISSIIHVPLMITFYNQTQAVDVCVACANDEFKEADYKCFNRSLGQYMDSMELAMYR